ncbi:hypothetical protein GOP47_0027592 [Adiantum capillus-veneris]|nr:hypothetical protein GOP47_0027592 [Adiantum capillus-veneris]
MGVAMETLPGRVDHTAKHIVFFDVETNVPGYICRSYELLEFGAVVLNAQGLTEVRSFHTLIRPADLSCIDRRTTDCNTITPTTVSDAPTFADVADEIYRLLHGHIWAGHNILKFDILRINEAFSKIGQPAPEPSGVIDTYPLLRKTFGKRAGNYKLATLANYCGYGKQEHRSVADVRMNINVLRSCATMLFLESNYPDIFMAQMELTTSTSLLEQSASFSTSSPQNGFVGNDNKEQEVDSQAILSDRAGDVSSATRPSDKLSSRIPFREDPDIEDLEGMNSLSRSELFSAFEGLKVDVCNSVKEDSSILGRQACTSCTNIVEDEKDEKCISPKLSYVSTLLKIDYIPEDAVTGYEAVSEDVSAAKVVDAKSEEVEILMNSSAANEGQLQNESTLKESVLVQDLLNALSSLSLGKGSGDIISSSAAQLSKAGSRMESGGVPFLLASHVILPSVELRSCGSSKVLYYNGFPLHLLEFKVRVRYTINASYAYDDKGKPRFSILMEPSEVACNVISKCEDLVKSTAASDSEIKWLPLLKKESGRWTARMRIGTKCMDSLTTYTTDFLCPTSNGLEKISLDPVDALTFRSVLPHGSVIDTGYGFYVFNVQNRMGLMLLAKHIVFS